MDDEDYLIILLLFFFFFLFSFFVGFIIILLLLFHISFIQTMLQEYRHCLDDCWNHLTAVYLDQVDLNRIAIPLDQRHCQVEAENLSEKKKIY